MRIASIYDIHGNLPALSAVCKEIAQAEIDAIVVGGDMVAGPMPRESLTFLRNLDIPVHLIQGNADQEVIADTTGEAAGAVPDQLSSGETVRFPKYPPASYRSRSGQSFYSDRHILNF